MSKRKYTYMMQMEPIILQMKEAGMIHNKIAAELILTTEQVKSCVWRYLKRKKAMSYEFPKHDIQKRLNGYVWNIFTSITMSASR